MTRNILKYLIIISVLLSGLTGLAAQGFLNNIEKGEIGGFPTLKGVTDSGIDVTVIQMAPMEDQDQEIRISKLVESFNTIPVHSVRITSKPGGLADLFFLYTPFEWEGHNMEEYLPSGFTLKIDGSVDYDLDLFIDRLHIRLEGFYRSETDLLNKIVSVIEDPGTFLMSRDPEYILNTFLSMMSADELIQQELAVQKEQDADMALRIDSLQEELEILRTEKTALEKDLAELKFNNLIMENRGAFGSIKMLDRAAVDWIISKKTANAALTVDELGSGLTSETGAEMKSKSITLILGLYFGEYAE